MTVYYHALRRYRGTNAERTGLATGGLAIGVQFIESDTGNAFMWNGTSWVEEDVVTQFGDADGGNYATFAADGELTLVGTARVTRFTWIPAQGLRAPGLKPATYVDHGISGAWEFTDGQEEIVVGNIAIPSDADLTGDLYIYLGWSSPTVSQDCDWEVAYLLTQLNEDTTAAAQQTLQSYEESSATGNGLVMSAFTIANAQVNAADRCIHLSIMRDGNDGSDNLGAAARLHGLCLSYIANKLGTVT